MDLLQIHEPGQTPLPHEDENNNLTDEGLAVGIDLGTTHSLVAYAIENNDGKREVKIFKNKAGYLLPSIIEVNGTKISSVKRLLGRGIKDIEKFASKLQYEVTEKELDGAKNIYIKTANGEDITPVEVSAKILQELKATAEENLQKPVTKAVITVPAYFDDTQREATKQAAQIAGLKVLRLVNEPTAAALSYGLDNSKEGIYAVYDLGGGTFDISILKLVSGVFQVLATGGCTEIGGDDADRVILDILSWQCQNKLGKPINFNKSQIEDLLKISREIKHALSENAEAVANYKIEDKEFTLKVSRQEFEQVFEPFVAATIELSKQALKDAGVDIEDINGVVFVGGSTRVPLVRKLATEFFEKSPEEGVDPDKVVAYGAALQAYALTEGADKNNNLLLDVIPLSLGIEIMGGLCEKIIERNTPIPVSKAQEFTTFKDGQTAMSLHVVQGEREMAADNRSLARFTFKGIPPAVAGAVKIKVIFQVDADGLLTVSALEEVTGTKQTVEVKPAFGLSNEQMIGMIRNAMVNAKQDIELKLITEAIIDATSLINATKTALKQDKELLQEDEKNNIEAIITDLEKTIAEKQDRDRIKALAETLEKSTRNFAEKRMDKYVSLALKGKEIK